MAEDGQKGRASSSKRYLIGGGASLLLLLIAALLFIYSPWFFTLIILPTLTDSAQIDFEYESLSGGYFDPVRLHNGTFRSGDNEPFLLTSELASDYGPIAVLLGKASYSFAFSNPRLNFITSASGSNNYQPVVEALTKPNQNESGESGGFRLELLAVRDGALYHRQEFTNRSARTLILANTSFNLTNYVSGRTSVIHWATAVRGYLPALDGAIRASWTGQTEIDLSDRQHVQAVDGSSTLRITDFPRLPKAASIELVLALQKQNDRPLQDRLLAQSADQKLLDVTASRLSAGTNTLDLELEFLDHKLLDLFGLLPGANIHSFQAGGSLQLAAYSGLPIDFQSDVTVSNLVLGAFRDLPPRRLRVQAQGSLTEQALKLDHYALEDLSEKPLLTSSGQALIAMGGSQFQARGTATAQLAALSALTESPPLHGSVSFQGSALQDSASIRRWEGALQFQNVSTPFLTNFSHAIHTTGVQSNYSARGMIDLSAPGENQISFNAEWQSLNPLDASISLKSAGLALASLKDAFSSLGQSAAGTKMEGVPDWFQRLSIQADLAEVAWKTNSSRSLCIPSGQFIFAATNGHQALSVSWTAQTSLNGEDADPLLAGHLVGEGIFDPAASSDNFRAQVRSAFQIQQGPEELPPESAVVFELLRPALGRLKAELAFRSRGEALASFQTEGIPFDAREMSFTFSGVDRQTVRAFALAHGAHIPSFRASGHGRLSSSSSLPMLFETEIQLSDMAWTNRNGAELPSRATLTAHGRLTSEKVELEHYRLQTGPDLELESSGQASLAWDLSTVNVTNASAEAPLQFIRSVASGETQQLQGTVLLTGAFAHRKTAEGAVQSYDGKAALRNFNYSAGPFQFRDFHLGARVQAARTNSSAVLDFSFANPPAAAGSLRIAR